jgi:hypothetical protein
MAHAFAGEDFPRLALDTPESCPCPLKEIQEYLALEDGDDPDHERNLRFLRTARAFGADFWIWEYSLEDGVHCYVTVEQSQDGLMVGMDWGTGDLTPEQYIVDQRRRTGRI